VEGGFRPGPDRTKLWHPLGAPGAFPPHAGDLFGSKIISGFISGHSANPNPVAKILFAPGPRKSRFGTPLEPCRSRTQPSVRYPPGRLRLPCTPARSAGVRGRRAPSVSLRTCSANACPGTAGRSVFSAVPGLQLQSSHVGSCARAAGGGSS
jgi:hypothetical protein